MENWQKVWREGFAPQLSTPSLQALKKALEEDDPRLLQGATTTPPPLQCVQDWPVEAACAITFCGVVDKDGGFARKGATPIEQIAACTVGQAEEFFARACYECDRRTGEPAGCRWFLNWFDETPRDEMRRLLMEEVNLTLNERFVNEARQWSEKTK